MPWCEPCERFYNPNSLTVGGDCPRCGEPVQPPDVGAAAPSDASTSPWHFKLLIAATAVYLGYRAFQGLVWVVQQL